MVGGEIGQRDAHRLRGIDAIGDRHEKARGADRILCVSTDDTEISNQLSGEFDRDAGPGPLGDADKAVGAIAAYTKFCLGPEWVMTRRKSLEQSDKVKFEAGTDGCTAVTP